MNKKIIVVMLVATMLLSNTGVAAHHGGSSHRRARQNNCGTINRYYNCEGHEAHLHQNGSCPYAVAVTDATIKDIQQKLNDLGHACGIPDGVMGGQTKSAIKAFQKAQGLTADGVVGTATKKALGL